MIPTYNCLSYLPETLASVLAQDPGPEYMQIAVVDDCSTDGDVRALVQAIGKNRVEYYQQEKNLGSLRNFEMCLNRSTGQWIHILHGDDLVAPGFYSEIERLFREYPEAGAAFTNTGNLFAGQKEVVARTPLASKPGVLKNFLLTIAECQQLETPAIVVKRKVYEHLGGFFAVHYGEDWEMWTRIAAHYPIAYSPECLAHYRYLNNTSITHRSVRNGQNVRDIIKVCDIIQGYLPSDQRKRIRQKASRHYAFYCISMANALYTTELESALIQAKGALRLSKDPEVLYLVLKLYLKMLLNGGFTKYFTEDTSKKQHKVRHLFGSTH
ncbi:glycosyltransferase family 2 protein [Hymenobacter crusticola]|uniref:Glycosyltransferase 2-like domain-containing protein n=1 Tax=Hymenobacter crusticola TaxID=1770526 RepID=A0A243W8F7_9BACT|nr:glycosyltransferase [Hymenobacter crusticola]OUJ71212.1 hypothetical protein BXP70_22285 [Hymenobacter crusticola]